MASRWTYYADIVGDKVHVYRAKPGYMYSDATEKAAIKRIHDGLSAFVPKAVNALVAIRAGKVTRTWETK